jgi:glycosyltransferase involved in cell wall biosynthesis
LVDDGSTDETPAIAAKFRDQIRYHRKVNGGLSAARNTGMELAANDLVVFLDADDILEPIALSRLVQAWKCRSVPPVVVGSMNRMISAMGEWLNPPNSSCDGSIKVFITSDFILRNRFAPIVLANRSVLLSLGGFDPLLKASEDRDIRLRASTTGDVMMLCLATHRKRDHGANMSRHAHRQTESIFQVLAKAKSNPAIKLSSRVWSDAYAICYYQSARMYLSAGERKQAIMQCLLSLKSSPWATEARGAGYPFGFRLKFLFLRLLEGFGLIKQAAGLAKKGGIGEKSARPSSFS